MKVVIVSGSVGSGKSTVSKKIAKHFDYEYVDVNRLIENYNLSCGYDRKNKCKIVDVSRLNKVLVSMIKAFGKDISGAVIDSHLSHYLPAGYVDLCVITKCDIKKLSLRLKKRGYDKKKIKDNVECEIFDVCYNEALDNGHRIFVINTTKRLNMDSLSRRIKWQLTHKQKN